MFKYKYTKIQLILSNGQTLKQFSNFFIKPLKLENNYFNSNILIKNINSFNKIKTYKQISKNKIKTIPINN